MKSWHPLHNGCPIEGLHWSPCPRGTGLTTARVVRTWIQAPTVIGLWPSTLEGVRPSLHALLLTSNRAATTLLLILRNSSFPTNPSGNNK